MPPALCSAADHPMRFEYGANEVEHALGMAARRDLMEGPRDAQVGVEHEGGTRGDAAAEHTEGARQLAFRVREQDKGESVLFGERAMGLHGIDADADEGALERRESLIEVAKFLALDRASRRVVGRVEVDHEAVAAKLRQPALVAMLVAKRDLGGRAQIIAGAQSLSGRHQSWPCLARGARRI